MSEIVTIENTEMQIREYNGQRVVTLKDIDRVHMKKTDTAKKAFQKYKKHFVLGTDYFELTRKELGERYSPNEKIIGNPNIKTYLFTESGYLMIVKVFTDDLSWAVQRQLVNSYFRNQQPVVEQKPQLTPEEIVDWKLNDLHKRVKELEGGKSDKFALIDLKLNDLHRRLKAIEERQVANFHEHGRLKPRENTWYEKNRNRIWRIRYDKNMELRELYHLILEECGKYYDMDEAEQIYRSKEGAAPTYGIDLVEYFPELQDIANQVLDYFEG